MQETKVLRLAELAAYSTSVPQFLGRLKNRLDTNAQTFYAVIDFLNFRLHGSHEIG